MSKISDLIDQNNECTKELKVVQNNLANNLKNLSSILYPIFEKYQELFDDLKSEAELIAVSFPEIYPDEFGRLGNQGLTRLSYEFDGFVTLHSKEYFRNETDYYEAYLPKKYLKDNGLELLENDARRINAEIKAIKFSQELGQANSSTDSKKIKI